MSGRFCITNQTLRIKNGKNIVANIVSVHWNFFVDYIE